MTTLVPLFGPVGPELLVIVFILVLLFGANRIPKLARSSGQAVTEFKKGREDIEAELEQSTSETESAETDPETARNS